MKTIKIKIIAALFSTLFSFSSFAQEHVTMSVRNITATANTIEYDLYILNDGSIPLKLSACSFGVNFNEAILNGGTLTYNYHSNNRSSTSTGLRNFSLGKTKVASINQARMISSSSTFENAAELMPKQLFNVGHFKMTNSQNWTRNSDPSLALQELQAIGLTTTQVIAFLGNNKKLVALTPNLKTVNVEVENAPLLNTDESSFPYATNAKFEMVEKSKLNDKVLSRNSELKIYPNPAMDELNVEFYSLQETKIQIQIADMNGRLVKQIQAQVSKEVNKISLSISDLKAGMYTLRIHNLSKTFQKY